MTDAQTAHNARNAAAKAARQERAVSNYLAHVARNNRAAEDAASLRASRREMNAEIHGFRNDAQAQDRANRRDANIARHHQHNADLANWAALRTQLHTIADMFSDPAGLEIDPVIVDTGIVHGDPAFVRAQRVLPLAA